MSRGTCTTDERAGAFQEAAADAVQQDAQNARPEVHAAPVSALQAAPEVGVRLQGVRRRIIQLLQN